MMCITGNPMKDCKDRKNLTLLYSQADLTHYMHVLKVHNSSQVKYLTARYITLSVHLIHLVIRVTICVR